MGVDVVFVVFGLVVFMLAFLCLGFAFGFVFLVLRLPGICGLAIGCVYAVNSVGI